MDNNWIVENLTNAFGVWNSKMTEMWSLLTESPQTFKGGTIGELVMNKLKDLDAVAYVRFASVYREFKDVNTFMDELKSVLNDKNHN